MEPKMGKEAEEEEEEEEERSGLSIRTEFSATAAGNSRAFSNSTTEPESVR